MSNTIFQTPEYTEIMHSHMSKVIHYLFAKNCDFSIACEVEHITFSPELPAKLSESFNDVVLFVLTGYTRESANFEEGYFSFEAGFGSENFGSRLILPLLSIKQIFVEDSPIILNFIDYGAINKPQESIQKASAKTSMEALLNNPKNKHLRDKA
jgi:hypothetical protein